MRKKICCVIIACVMCLTPSALLQAQGEGIAPCSNSWCEDGMHMGQPTELISGKYDYDGSGHWIVNTFLVKCRNCGTTLGTADQVGSKDAHVLYNGKCLVCPYK